MSHSLCLQLALLHTAGHYSNFVAVSKGSAQSIKAAIGVDFGEDSAVPSAGVLLFLTLPGATGHALLLVMLVAYPFVLQAVRKLKFEWFMFSHYALFFCMVGLLCVHGTAAWLAPPAAGYWLALPTVLLTWQLSRRACPGRHLLVDVKAVGVRPGKIVRLEMSKPPPPFCSCLRILGMGVFRKLGCGPIAARAAYRGGSAVSLWSSLQLSAVHCAGEEHSLQAPPKRASCGCLRPQCNRRDIVPLDEQLKHVPALSRAAIIRHMRALQQGQGGTISPTVQVFGARGRARKSNQARMRQATFPYVPGQYMFISVPQVAGGQWHPFTISSAPHSDRLVLNIKPSGDFTMQLYDACKQTIAGDMTEEQVLAQLLVQARSAMPGAKGSGARLAAADVDFMSGAPKAAANAEPATDKKRASIFVPAAGSSAASPTPSALARMSFRPDAWNGRGRPGATPGTQADTDRKLALPRSIYVDGPYPAPAQLACTSYEYVVFVGGGIGGTPLGSFLSHLSHLSATCRQVRSLAMQSQLKSKFSASSFAASGDASVAAAWAALVPPLMVSPLQHAKVVWTSKTQPQMEALWDELLAATAEQLLEPDLGTHCPAAGPGCSPLKRTLDVQLYATSRKVQPSIRQSIGMPQNLLESLDPSKAAKLMRARRASMTGDEPPPLPVASTHGTQAPGATPATPSGNMVAISEADEDGDSDSSTADAAHVGSTQPGRDGTDAPRRHGTISFSPFTKRLQNDQKRAFTDIELGSPGTDRVRPSRSGSVGADSRQQFHPQGATAVERNFASQVVKVNKSVDTPTHEHAGGKLAGIRRFLLSAGGDDSDVEDDTEQWEGTGREDSNGSEEESPTTAMGAVELTSSAQGCDDDEGDDDEARAPPPVTVGNPLAAVGADKPAGNSQEGLSRADRASRLGNTNGSKHSPGSSTEGVASPGASESGYSEQVHTALQRCVFPGRPKFGKIFEDMLDRVWEDQKRRHAALSLLLERGELPGALRDLAVNNSTRTVRVGVFFCGPRPMGDSLKAACAQISRDFVPITREGSNGLPMLRVQADFHKESFW